MKKIKSQIVEKDRQDSSVIEIKLRDNEHAQARQGGNSASALGTRGELSIRIMDNIENDRH